ncbi:MAG: hypothetical protein ACRDRR_11255 [Pseudonocardiaceae bacterium]
MARPDDVRLTIAFTSGSPTAGVTIRYVIRFNDDDVAGNRRYRERIQLFGEDAPAGPAGDDLLFTFFPSRIVRPNGQTTVQRTLTAQVPNAILDEDPGADQDEIYARVCLRSVDQTPPVQRCARSAAVSV